MRELAVAMAFGLTMAQVGGPAQAMQIVECSSPGHPDIAISLHARNAFGHDLSCIRAPFISDMTPCAPAGGFGLSAGTGDARLVGIVMDWRDYSGHTGGITAFIADEAQYYFSGLFHSIPGGTKELWRFVVSRVSGTGTLTLKGQAPIAYSCRAGAQKF